MHSTFQICSKKKKSNESETLRTDSSKLTALLILYSSIPITCALDQVINLTVESGREIS